MSFAAGMVLALFGAAAISLALTALYMTTLPSLGHNQAGGYIMAGVFGVPGAACAYLGYRMIGRRRATGR